jgi:hypothetical protein
VRARGAAAGPYELVSWPGYIGALSGLAPGRFAVTLNAAISRERPSITRPVVLLIRPVLEACGTYCEALELLQRTPIAADCLLLLTGTRAGEMAVIERTSTRASRPLPLCGIEMVEACVETDIVLIWPNVNCASQLGSDRGPLVQAPVQYWRFEPPFVTR